LWFVLEQWKIELAFEGLRRIFIDFFDSWWLSTPG